MYSHFCKVSHTDVCLYVSACLSAADWDPGWEAEALSVH